ncbi:Wall-associated receptor kinase 4 [Camellia lanceoleosa]|uniref:Wall-associated receptor kinase 4 n=1 Tax=Camellia lanceoleosa TaxID=1840588 RepID=A0ACC0HQ40_9ERIC|nr:Wall-associated receptor kinase 4 [Camellia lanceoleosa]
MDLWKQQKPSFIPETKQIAKMGKINGEGDDDLTGNRSSSVPAVKFSDERRLKSKCRGETTLFFSFLLSRALTELNQVLENRVAKEGDAEQIRRVAKLAKKCLRLKGYKRPSMKEVKKELEASGNSVKKRVKIGSDLKENELLMSEPFNLYDSGRSTSFDSLRSQVVLQMDDGQ